MATERKQHYCRTCEKKTLHERHTFSGLAGLVLTVLTCGLFLILWLPLVIIQAFTNKFTCNFCGEVA